VEARARRGDALCFYIATRRADDAAHRPSRGCRSCESGGNRVSGSPAHLRHATGYYLANAGQDTRAIQRYLGHKNIQHTVRHTELASGRFKDFWKD
jgi:integrase